jgi:hypothetical protein
MADVVRCRYVTGLLAEVEVEDLNEFLTPASVLEQRLVKVNGRVYVRKYVSRPAGERNPRLYDLLDNEIRAGTRLGQAFPDRYPDELTRLVAYNIDAEEPFVLLTEYIGAPAPGQVAKFGDAQRRQFEQGLLRALHLASTAGVVHGAVTMEALRWDSGQVQLVDFESAERIGEPRRSGGGVVDERDDVLSAGHLIRRLHLDPPPPDRGRDPQRLRALLDPVFTNPVDRQPTLEQLLTAVRADHRPAGFVNPEQEFEAGRLLFDQVSQRKRGTSSPVTPPSAAPASSSPLQRLFFRLTLAVLVLAAVVTTLIVVLS